MIEKRKRKSRAAIKATKHKTTLIYLIVEALPDEGDLWLFRHVGQDGGVLLVVHGVPQGGGLTVAAKAVALAEVLKGRALEVA